MAIEAFPRAAAYLRGMNFRLTEPGMTDYWWAVMLADAAFKDDELTAAGVSFGEGRVAQRDGTAILGSLEALMHQRRDARKPRLGRQDMDQLRAFFGSRGVKAGRLVTDEDFREVAGILWPHVFKRRRDCSLHQMLAALRGMTKKSRQSARDNLHKVPSKFMGAA